MTSQQVLIQRWNGSSFQDVVDVTDPVVGAATVRTFSPIQTNRIRIWQPANSGAVDYSGVLWISELEVMYAPGADMIPPANIQDLTTGGE